MRNVQKSMYLKVEKLLCYSIAFPCRCFSTNAVKGFDVAALWVNHKLT